MKYYLILGIAVLFLSVTFSMQKLYQKRAGTSLQTGFGYTALLGGCSALFFFCMNGFSLKATSFSVIAAALMSGICILYTLLGFRILVSGNLALYTLSLMSGGMILPYVYGLLFLNEPFSVMKLLGLLLILTSAIVSNISSGTKNLLSILFCAAVFCLNGLVSIISKVHQIETLHPTVSAVDFVVLCGTAKFVLSGVAYLFFCRRKPKERPKDKMDRKVLFRCSVVILCAAFADGISYCLQLIAASSLPASVMYPFITGGGIVVSASCGVLFFHDKLSRRVILSTVVCFIGTLLFL